MCKAQNQNADYFKMIQASKKENTNWNMKYTNYAKGRENAKNKMSKTPFSLPDVLCDPTDLIWRKGTSFEAITGRTAPSSDGLLAEVLWCFPQL